MQSIAHVVRLIDAFNTRIGRGLAWITLLMVLTQFAIVVMRYIFGVSIIKMQESIVYMHSFVFLIGAGYTMLREGHVRVDIFYREAAPRTKAIVDFLGAIVFLIPVCVLITWYTWPYVSSSWAVWEGSKETSGIQAVYVLKTTILLFTFVMTLQGISMALRSFLLLAGHNSGTQGNS